MLYSLSITIQYWNWVLKMLWKNFSLYWYLCFWIPNPRRVSGRSESRKGETLNRCETFAVPPQKKSVKRMRESCVQTVQTSSSTLSNYPPLSAPASPWGAWRALGGLFARLELVDPCVRKKMIAGVARRGNSLFFFTPQERGWRLGTNLFHATLSSPGPGHKYSRVLIRDIYIRGFRAISGVNNS